MRRWAPRKPSLLQTGLGKLPLANFLPAILPSSALLVLAARIKFGPSVTPADGTLVVLGLLSYIFAAAALVTNFWAPIGFLQRLGLWTDRSAPSSTCRAGWCGGSRPAIVRTGSE